MKLTLNLGAILRVGRQGLDGKANSQNENTHRSQAVSRRCLQVNRNQSTIGASLKAAIKSLEKSLAFVDSCTKTGCERGQSPMTKVRTALISAAVLMALVVVVSSARTAGASDSFMDPQGPIAAVQKAHLLRATWLILIAVVPVLVLVPLIALRYRRRKGSTAAYRPDWDFSPQLEMVMWGVPVVIVTILSVYLWKATHRLDPYAAPFGDEPAVQVQVVGLDWKWLFIYPDLGIATVGEMGIPVKQQIALTLTTDTVMQSFMIPALAGQIYAMPGMTTQLHLVADRPEQMQGENTQYNGRGFTKQKFETLALSAEDFDAWVEGVRQNGIVLDEATYKTVAMRSDRDELQQALGTSDMPENALYFRVDDGDLFQSILHRYHSGQALPHDQQPGTASYGQGVGQ
ncbi:cytochrome ubiquinol oxidase subunit II [Ruegeria sp.]|uniref:cytochrome ubiquinol oxidase subunit II n=1 Tax=Ruegeria sp. TaxID=1879320 RepID=UPI003AFF82CA